MKRLTCLVLLALPLTAAGQGSANRTLTVSSGAFRFDARPGGRLEGAFEIAAQAGLFSSRFAVRAEDWWRSEDGAETFYDAPGTLTRSCAPWVTITSGPRLALTPGSATPATVRFTVSVPAGVEPGGYWCAITVDEQAETPPTPGGGTRFLLSVAKGLHIDVAPVRRAARVLNLAVEDGAARIRVRNDGDAPLNLGGRIEFRSPGADTVIVDVPRRTILTQPSRDATLVAALPEAGTLAPGRYRVRVTLATPSGQAVTGERDVTIDRSDARRDAAGGRGATVGEPGS